MEERKKTIVAKILAAIFVIYLALFIDIKVIINLNLIYRLHDFAFSYKYLESIIMGFSLSCFTFFCGKTILWLIRPKKRKKKKVNKEKAETENN